MAKRNPNPPPALTVREVAARLRCGVKGVCKLIRRGELRAALVGHQYRIQPEALDELFRAGRLWRSPLAKKPRPPRPRARRG